MAHVLTRRRLLGGRCRHGRRRRGRRTHRPGTVPAADRTGPRRAGHPGRRRAADHASRPAPEGVEVDFWTAVPEGYGDGRGLPVCLVLHGASATARDFPRFGFARFLTDADAGRPPFVLAGASGGRLSWRRSGDDDPQRWSVRRCPPGAPGAASTPAGWPSAAGRWASARCCSPRRTRAGCARRLPLPRGRRRRDLRRRGRLRGTGRPVVRPAGQLPEDAAPWPERCPSRRSRAASADGRAQLRLLGHRHPGRLRPARRHAHAAPDGVRPGPRRGRHGDSVRVEALAGLAAQVTGGDHALQQLRREELLVRGVGVDVLVACSSTSTPVRSVVASGPIAWPKPSWQAMSRSSGDDHAGLDQLHRLDDQRGDQPGGDEAGDVPVDHDAGLADLLGERPRRRPASRRGSCSRGPARRASSSAPARRSGCRRPTPAAAVTAAIWVTGIAEVLVASTASALQILSSARNTSCLTSSRSKTASTTMSASAAALQVGGRGDPAERRLDVLRGDLCPSRRTSPATSGCRRGPARWPRRPGPAASPASPPAPPPGRCPSPSARHR